MGTSEHLQPGCITVIHWKALAAVSGDAIGVGVQRQIGDAIGIQGAGQDTANTSKTGDDDMALDVAHLFEVALLNQGGGGWFHACRQASSGVGHQRGDGHGDASDDQHELAEV